jgi:hypothetical protein
MSAPHADLGNSALPTPVIGRLGLSAISLIVANATVLFLLLHYDLSPIQVVLVYWCECVWIGLFSAAKLALASVIGDPYENRWATFSKGSALLISIVTIFFCSSAFFSVLGVVLAIVVSVQHSLGAASSGVELLDDVSLVIGTSMVLAASHGISFVANFLILGEFRRARFGDLIMLPFKRSLALLAAILLGLVVVVLVPWLASTTLFAAIVIVLKVLWDLHLHNRERQVFAVSGGGNGTS